MTLLSSAPYTIGHEPDRQRQGHEVGRDRLRIEVEDGGGPWRDGPRDDEWPHGFDVVAAIAGAGNRGIDGDACGRIAWATLGW
jgi:hypothetical protein